MWLQRTKPHCHQWQISIKHSKGGVADPTMQSIKDIIGHLDMSLCIPKIRETKQQQHPILSPSRLSSVLPELPGNLEQAWTCVDNASEKPKGRRMLERMSPPAGICLCLPVFPSLLRHGA